MAIDQVILDGEVDWGHGNVNYHIFDILWLNGRDLMPWPLMDGERSCTISGCGVRCTRSRRLAATNAWERACLEGWEGVIAKRRDSPYEHRRLRIG